MSGPDQTERGDDDRVRAAEYALGLLPPEEARAFEDRLAQDVALRAIYAQWAEDFARLTDDIPEIDPPSALRNRIEVNLFGKDRRPGWARIGIGTILAGAVAGALLLYLVASQGWLRPDAALTPDFTARIAAEDDSLVVAAAIEERTGRLIVERRAGAARPGRVLELWLISGENAPVSLGVLPEESQAVLTVPDDLRDAVAGSVLAISDEPPGGSPTGVPTGDVLAVGPITDA